MRLSRSLFYKLRAQDPPVRSLMTNETRARIPFPMEQLCDVGILQPSRPDQILARESFRVSRSPVESKSPTPRPRPRVTPRFRVSSDKRVQRWRELRDVTVLNRPDESAQTRIVIIADARERCELDIASTFTVMFPLYTSARKTRIKLNKPRSTPNNLCKTNNPSAYSYCTQRNAEGIWSLKVSVTTDLSLRGASTRRGNLIKEK